MDITPTAVASAPAQGGPADAAALVAALARGLPDGRLVTDPDVLAPLSHDDAEWAPSGAAVAAVRARTEDEVRHVVRTCAEFRAPIVPRGAGTGLSGGANATAGCVVLDLSRMNQVLEVDADNLICRVQPGVVNNDLKAAVGHPRPVVPARPGQRPLVDHRRQRRHQRGRTVLPQVRRHPRLRARAAGRGRRRPRC
jgi:glycolate oxidase